LCGGKILLTPTIEKIIFLSSVMFLIFYSKKIFAKLQKQILKRIFCDFFSKNTVFLRLVFFD